MKITRTMILLTLNFKHMKAIILGFLILTFNIKTFSQINLEHTYTGMGLQTIYLSHSGFKYFGCDGSNIKLYNTNHSLFKSIPIPINSNLINNTDILYISEDLFDSDTSNIEYLQAGLNQLTNQYETRIFDELGNQIFFRDTCCNVSIIRTDNGCKMVVQVSDIMNYTYYEIYSLPGCLPSLCCYNNNFTKINDNSENNNESRLIGYPNPTNDYIQIEYELKNDCNEGTVNFYNLSGILVKSFKVDNTFKNLKISTSDLKAGTYLYSVTSNNRMIGPKKLIIIK